MAIIIPSKNIYDIQNNKVIKNNIHGTTGEETIISTSAKELKNISLNPYIEETAKLLWVDYVQYSENWEINDSEISVMGMTQENGIYFQRIAFNIKSDNYIDKNSLRLNVSFQYRYGEGFRGTTGKKPVFYSNDRLSDINTKSVKDIVIGSRSVLLGAYEIVPIISLRTEFLKFVGDRDKNFSFAIYIPAYYNPVYTEETNRVDGVVFTNFSISLNANIYDFSTKEKKSYGTQPQITLSSNEFFQNTTNYSGENVFDSLSKRVISQYKDGKETATILCSISDYYDENGEKSIAIDNSTRKMSFKIGDKIIPMIFGADGNERPMSIYKDRSPKVFKVIGIKKFYDGAVWQELTTQEVKQGE